jgi:2,3-bisphosphoglycerate-dependent phosphoglycerate mutase
MFKIVLLRHGESIWNSQNRFTGWVDVDLSPKGIKEAQNAGKTLKKEKYVFDIAYTSILKRAIRTTWLVLDQMDLMWIPTINSWRLNERHYGALQGLNKKEMTKKYGQEQVFAWRRSFSVRPPALSENNLGHPLKDAKYKNLLKEQLPSVEALEDACKRVLPFWDSVIVPAVKEGKKILVSAHGNSLRAIVKHLDQISDEEIAKVNIPTGVPLVYELDDNLKPVKHYYLGDPIKIAKQIEKVKKQSQSK